MAVVGIDLGTTNTVIACVRDGEVHVLADEEGYRLLPSVVSFHPNGDVLVGRGARERRLVDAQHTIASIKRLIGRPWDSDEMRIARSRFSFELREGAGQGALIVARGETYTLPEISAFVLKRARQIAEAALGEPVDRAVITVPAHFNELQRASTKVAGRVAGLEVLRILNEPTAAALAYGFGSDRSERVAVYDFGGGTFDCSVLDLTGSLFEVLATSGDTFLGGDDIDTAIAEVMCSAFLAEHRYDPRVDPQAFERLRSAAEELKRALSVNPEAQIEIPEVAHGVEGRALGFTFGMTQADLDAIAAPFIERTLEVTQDALTVAHLSASSLDQIILVGGSTRMPMVARRVEAFFGLAVNDRVDPDEVVAIGAAVQAAALMDQSRSRSFPTAPTPGVIGRPQPLDSEPPKAVPGARARGGSDTPKRIETLRPRAVQTLRPPVEVGVPPQAPLLAPNATAAMLGRTGEDRSFITANRGVVANPAAHLRDDDRNERSFGSNLTLPAGKSAADDEALSTTNVRFGSPLGTPAQTAPNAGRVRTVPNEDPPPNTRAAGAPRIKTKANEAEGQKRGAGWGAMKPLDTEDISLVGAATGNTMASPEWGKNFPSNPPSAPASNSLSPRGVNVGPLPTEDVSIFSVEGARAPHSDLPSPIGGSGFDLPSAMEEPPPSAGLPTMQHGLPARPAFEMPAFPPSPMLPRSPEPPPPPPAPRARAPEPQPPPVPPPRTMQAAPAQEPPKRPATQPRPDPPSDAGSFASRISFDVSPSMSDVVAPRRDLARTAAPILVDVTPCALVVETVGGYCDTVIPRNATIPCEHTRVFATGRDLQNLVHVRVAQGEEEKFDANQYLGEVEVTNLRPAPRGEVLLSVTFEIDANGSLVVRAIDASTGRKAEASMKLITVTQSESEIEEMIERSLSVSVKARV